MTINFGRVVEFRVGTAVLGGLNFKSEDNIRVIFSTKASTRRFPNKTTVELYNVAEGSHAVLRGPGVTASLVAGYAKRLHLIAQGGIEEVDTKWNGRDFITTITMGDGEFAYREARVNRTYGPGTTSTRIISDIIAGMGLARGFAPLDLPVTIYAEGVTLRGLARKALTDVLDDVGAEWSIQQGSVQILTDDATPTRGRGVVVSDSTGLKVAEAKKNGVAVTTEFNGAIKPGGVIKLESRVTEGFFTVRKVEHKGEVGGSGGVFDTIFTARRRR